MLRHVMRRRLLAAMVCALTAVVPLTVHASSAPDVNALWNEPDGLPVDSAFYVVQLWWNRINQAMPSDPTERGLFELSQANTDLLSADTLLDAQRNTPGAQPVALIDPLLSTLYNAVTGSNVKAPVGSLVASINQSLLNLEGRGTRLDITRGLLQDYRIKQAVALRDLRQNSTGDLDALLAANAAREASWLAKIQGLSTPDEHLADLLRHADQSTTALAAHGKFRAGDQGESAGSDRGKSAASNGKAHDQTGAAGEPAKKPKK